MLKGLEISEVRLCDIDLNDRIDAEYFNKQDLKILSSLKHCGSVELRTLGEFFASAFYPAATQLYESGDVPFARCVDCISHPVITHAQDTSFERIPSDFISDNKGVSDLRRGDIIITKVGTPCYASIIHEHDRVALSRTVMGIGNIARIDPYYLLVFLRSKYGFSQLMRQRELTIQYQLTLERVKRILVYKPTDCFQQAIRKFVFSSLEKEKESLRQYGEAEQSLLAELGFDGWTPTEESVSVKNCSDFMSAGRFDAEYFQLKYDEIVAKIKTYLGGTIKAASVLVAGLVNESEDTPERYVELADIGASGEIAGCTVAAFGELPSRARQRMTTGQVIASSIEGSLDRCALVTPEYDKALCSTGFHRFSSQDINPETMLLLFKSWPIQQLMKRGCSGTILCGILPTALEHVDLPMVNPQVQKVLAAKVRESFVLRAESKRLLDLAKHAVEVAIEQGEERAMDMISTLLISKSNQQSK